MSKTADAFEKFTLNNAKQRAEELGISLEEYLLLKVSITLQDIIDTKELDDE